jgi:VanZ family protein
MFAFAIAPVLIATTYPFRPRMEREWVVWKLHNIDWRPATRRINYDTYQNVLLMMPLGLAVVCAGRRRRIRRTTVAAQIVLPGRYPQLVDVVNNVAGCTAAAVWAGLWRAARERRLAAVRA